jgi:hypothetical protein
MSAFQVRGLSAIMKWLAYLLLLVGHWFSAGRKLKRIEEVALRVLEGEHFWLLSEEETNWEEMAVVLAQAREGVSIPMAAAELAMENAADWLVHVIDRPIHPNDQDI